MEPRPPTDLSPAPVGQSSHAAASDLPVGCPYRLRTLPRARSASCRSHSVIRLRCRSHYMTSSPNVLSYRRAANTTFALSAAECARLVLLTVKTTSCRRSDAHGLPFSAYIASTSQHEVTLVEQTVDSSFLDHTPERLIGELSYGRNPLDRCLREERDVERKSSHRAGRRRHPSIQDSRPSRRYRKRWRIERLFAWLHNFRRFVTRYEYTALNFLGFVQIRCRDISRQF